MHPELRISRVEAYRRRTNGLQSGTAVPLWPRSHISSPLSSLLESSITVCSACFLSCFVVFLGLTVFLLIDTLSTVLFVLPTFPGLVQDPLCMFRAPIVSPFLKFLCLFSSFWRNALPCPFNIASFFFFLTLMLFPSLICLPFLWNGRVIPLMSRPVDLGFKGDDFLFFLG